MESEEVTVSQRNSELMQTFACSTFVAAPAEAECSLSKVGANPRHTLVGPQIVGYLEETYSQGPSMECAVYDVSGGIALSGRHTFPHPPLH